MAKIRVFCSYAHADSEAVTKIIDGLSQAHYTVWYDTGIGGGDRWWHKILDEIEVCNVFLLAVSQAYVDSVFCRAEMEYAIALNKPILPVIVSPEFKPESLPESLKEIQAILAQRLADKSPIIQITGAVGNLVNSPVAPPSPGVQRPPMPRSQIDMLRNRFLELSTLAQAAQTQLVFELRQIRDWNGNPRAKEQAAELLRQIFNSPYATEKTKTETGLSDENNSSFPSMRWILVGIIVLVIAGIIFAALSSGSTPPAPTPETPASPEESPTPSATVTLTITPSQTPTGTFTPTATGSFTPTYTSTLTLSATQVVTFRVTGLGVWLRTEPRQNAPIVISLVGVEVNVVGRSQDSQFFLAEYQGIKGWFMLNAAFADNFTGNRELLPVVSFVAPTLTPD